MRAGLRDEKSGGAANVAMNLAGLGASVTLMGFAGGDREPIAIGNAGIRAGNRTAADDCPTDEDIRAWQCSSLQSGESCVAAPSTGAAQVWLVLFLHPGCAGAMVLFGRTATRVWAGPTAVPNFYLLIAMRVRLVITD